MSVKRFRKNEGLEPAIKAKAPDWDKPFELQKKSEELVGIDQLADLIEQVVELMRKAVPKSHKDLVAIEQPMGKLNIFVRGGTRDHKDLHSWIPKQALPPLMKLLCSMRFGKQELERRLTPEKARELYHETLNCLRYVHEPEKPDVADTLVNTSGDTVLPGGVVSCRELKCQNVYRCPEYVFVGDEPRERHSKYADEILARLRSVEGKKALGKGGQGKSNRTTKLTDFIRDCCEDTASISSKANRIHEFVKKGEIEFMPKPDNNPKGNETKLYSEEALRQVWPKLKDKIKSLPNLKD